MQNATRMKLGHDVKNALLFAGAALAATTGLLGARPAHAADPAALPRPDHIVVVIEENKGFSQIVGSDAAPYMNSLMQQGALFTNSHGLTHPSQPNYLDLFAGSDFGIRDDKTPKQTLPATSLGGELKAANFSFRGYAEDLPAVGSTVSKQGRYARKHCPWIDFGDVAPSDSVPYFQEGAATNFPTDADGFSKLPTLAFAVPNLDNDMHDGTIEQGDAWLKEHMDAYVQWAKTHNSLLIITFDEDQTTAIQPNTIPTIFVGANIQPGRYDEKITHFNVLRTIEQMYGLPTAGLSANASPIADIWTAPAHSVVEGRAETEQGRVLPGASS